MITTFTDPRGTSKTSFNENSENPVLRSGHYITEIRSPGQIARFRTSLRLLLQLCVNPEPANSSIGFRAPLSDEEADAYWDHVSHQLGQSPKSLYLFVLTSFPDSEEVLATIQIVTVHKETHKHRAEVAKLLVHPLARRKGIATTIMDYIEEFCRDSLGKEMLTLDTASETPAKDFYFRMGWSHWGTCPEYAEYADGRRCNAMFFIKFIRGSNAA
ncbi:acyl-CoA N-acyltransferase [Xylariales sp. PMI_506]|nr:acyl-CoA N-acyltransferase [Xylariales sp. PMI_506]